MVVIKSLDELRRVRKAGITAYVEYVKWILEYVRARGDGALIELTKKFDGVVIKDVVVPSEELDELAKSLPDDVRHSIDVIYDHLKLLNRQTMPKDMLINVGGFSSGILWRPIESVGIYVPGGLKAYPSTLLMAAVPAEVAGVDKIYVATPPRRDGGVDAGVAYLARKIGVRKVYRVGGAQIVAAMAYGTESVERVDKIVGPGNIYVQVAKFLLQGTVSIDGVEGPTELVVVADDTANPDEVCLDMEAQSEHGPSSLVTLITTSDKLLKDVEARLKESTNTFLLIKVGSVDEAVALVNEVAPEHLSLKVEDPYTIAGRVRNVGAISFGKTPSAIIDYLGLNHILPTNGSARFRGGLSVYDFVKAVVVADGSPSKELLRAACTLAAYEGFPTHGRSVSVSYGHT